MKKLLLIALLVSATFCTTCAADIFDLRLTEIWVGRDSAPDGTRDWIEVTNLGDTPVNLSDVSYDDGNPMLATSLQLPPFSLAPGESFVLLIDIDADNAGMFPDAGQEFLAVWDPFDSTFLGGGSADGGLSNETAESANLLDFLNGALIDSLEFTPDFMSDQVQTFERIGEGFFDVRLSVDGENGAFLAQEFIDEDTGMTAVDSNGDPVLLQGSPGIFTGFMDVLVGDVNCDGEVNLLDVGPFVEAIGAGGPFDPKADINGDGVVNLLDVGPFVELLSGG